MVFEGLAVHQTNFFVPRYTAAHGFDRRARGVLLLTQLDQLDFHRLDTGLAIGQAGRQLRLLFLQLAKLLSQWCPPFLRRLQLTRCLPCRLGA
jgi:hypothetical protein